MESVSIPFSEIDVLVGIVFGLLVLILVPRIWRRWPDRNVLTAALVVKLVAAVALAAYHVFLYQGGDTLGYHESGAQLADLMRSDPIGGTWECLSTYPFFWVEGSSTDRTYNLSG